MASIKVIQTNKAPKPVGPYSQAISVDGWLFVSGQLPIDPETGKLVEGDFKEKVRRVMENIKAIVEAAGGTLRNVVKVTVYLGDISKFDEFNEVYSEYFKDHKPARSVVEAGIPKDAGLEVDVVAYISPKILMQM
ncbi:MAG: RidA family protein [Desulfurococcales archaeon]|nr:RidA family protein [Desulfurococcales archaeon]